jgi:hypothetical protein
LLVRVWLEDGPETFRARVTALEESDREDPPQALRMSLASSPGDVITAVSEWLDVFIRDHSDTEGDDG